MLSVVLHDQHTHAVPQTDAIIMQENVKLRYLPLQLNVLYKSYFLPELQDTDTVGTFR